MLKNITALTEFEKDILKQEIDLIDKTITRIDQIHLSLKNWAFLIWGGSLYLVTQQLGKSGILIVLTALIPLMFAVLDLQWVKQLLIVSFRQGIIADFINSENGSAGFILLDPINKRSRDLPAFKQATSAWKVIGYKGQIFFYIVLMVISLVFGIILLNKEAG